VLFEGGPPRGREPGRGPRALADEAPADLDIPACSSVASCLERAESDRLTLSRMNLNSAHCEAASKETMASRVGGWIRSSKRAAVIASTRRGYRAWIRRSVRIRTGPSYGASLVGGVINAWLFLRHRRPAAPVTYQEPMAASVASRIVTQAAVMCAAMTRTGG